MLNYYENKKLVEEQKKINENIIVEQSIAEGSALKADTKITLPHYMVMFM